MSGYSEWYKRELATSEIVKTMSSSVGENKWKIDGHCFKALKVLGKGSFGDVYLVEWVLAPDEEEKFVQGLGKFFAMKILPKQKIIKHNLIRYAITERKVMASVNHPFIIKLKYSY